ncbi:hypothetical protein JRQ81_013368 [Phrynocephalus forsythii]|uniref:Fibronectin type-III domain-containing protein n=1 Tax=Phrynocephalus forsythii TaxID=171643 RepID=A0A9Q0Y017_9SAUR|nr:hypothetical protein JRQ81_013368 [Phrynocephalus forsythii]
MLSSTTILVQWEEPEEPNGQIQGYRVYYTMDPSQHVNNWLKHNVADSHITTIGNLIPQKTYSVKVLAFTSVGDGPLSTLPKPPETTATSITLTWDSGNPEPVSYYIIQHKPKNSEEPYKEIDGVATTRYSVAGLSPYSEYEFRVVAVNNIASLKQKIQYNC